MALAEQHGEQCHRGILRIDGAIPFYEYRPTLSYNPVRGPIWTVTDGIFRTIVVEGDAGVIAFDTFYSPGAAQAYGWTLNRMLPRKPIHSLIYTHDHLDHTGFGADLVQDVDIICHKEAADVITARRSDGQLPPTDVWSGERRNVSLDGVDFDLLYPGPTHGNGNVAAYFPEERALFIVDTVAAGSLYNCVPDYHFSTWVPAIERLLALDWDILIPGHFWPLNRKQVQDSLDLWSVVSHTGELALCAGVDYENYEDVKRFTYEQLDAQYGDLFRFDEFMTVNVMRHMTHFVTGGWGLEDVERVPEGPISTTKAATT